MSLSKKELTKAMLEELGVVDVLGDRILIRDTGRTRGMYVECDNRAIYPSLSKQTDKKGNLRYISTTICIYNPKEKSYKSFSHHKLLWAWHYGYCPDGYEIDHINTNPLDNRLENLRLVSLSENGKNRRKWKMFTMEEISNKSVEEVKNMIDKRIEEYEDNPYYEQVKKEKKELKRKQREETKEERTILRAKRCRITTLKKQIKRLENEILHYRTKDEFHSEDWLNRKVKELSEDIVTKRAELIDLES